MKATLDRAQERGLLILLGLAVVAAGLVLIVDHSPSERSLRAQAIHLSEVRILLPRFVRVGPIDVNTASHEELQALAGIGPAMAQKIVEFRTLHGPFETLDDLQDIRGIGPKTIEGFRDRAVAHPPQ